MAWAEFKNLTDFNQWHSEIKTILGIPRDFTKEYTVAIQNPNDERVVAYIDEQINTDSMLLLSNEELKEQGWDIFLDNLKGANQ